MPYLLLVFACLGMIISCIGLSFPCIQQFDHTIVAWMSSVRSPFLSGFARGLSLLGGFPFLLVICVISCIRLAWVKSYTNILFICITIFGSATSGWLLKYLINRPRPDLVDPFIETYGASFPSAHSLYAVILAGLAVFIFRKHKQIRVITGLACLWWIGMGVSRVYLGAHYPTDVLAGWSLGFIWIAMLWLALRNLSNLRKN